MTHIKTRWTAFSQKRIEISSTQRLLKVFRKQNNQMVLLTYVEKRKVELKLPEDQKAMFIINGFKGQITDKVTKFIEENNCVTVHVLNND